MPATLLWPSIRIRPLQEFKISKIMRLTAIFFFSILLALTAAAQKTVRPKVEPTPITANAHLSSSAAYAEILLRQTELESELESLILDYTEDYPKIKENRQALEVLRREVLRIAVAKPADSSKLTSALGKLVVRKVDVEMDLWRLSQNYADNHPEVRRAKRKVEIFEKAIKEILG